MASVLLNKAIKELGYENGDLYDTSNATQKLTNDDWLNKSDWLKSAKTAGADRVLFIDNNPVVVFAHCASNERERKFNSIWCLSRPRLLFLESPGELSIIDLDQAPIDPDNGEHILEVLERTNEHFEKLQWFNYENVESGKAFDERFGDLSNRADFALINDLRVVKAELKYKGLDYSPAHKLIVRSIFIRYLEDRKILTEEYYKKVAVDSKAWQKILETDTSEDLLDFSENTHSLYARVLQSKSFTYALFDKLTKDFNGDMFPDIAIEKEEVTDEHLKTLRDLLYGNVGIQRKLFFYSYRFDIIPLSLISAICEEFYHNEPISEKERKNNARKNGAFYTSPILVEFLLSKVLTADVLKNKPKILDPACGSGIFLVEAFRRIIRFNTKNGKVMDFDDLKGLLKEQIVGIEINEDAARITAFSLNLALLNYLEPPSIIEQISKGNRLPNLVDFGKPTDDRHFNIIQNKNAFKFDSSKLGKFDVIVGNPPWGKVSDENKNRKTMLKWCIDKNYPISNKESSQAFLYYASDLLKSGGHCAMLVSSGVLLNDGAKIFRECLFSNICIKEVYNFIHTRYFFFNKAISPFLLLHFTKEAQKNTAIDYWSAKLDRMLMKTQAIVFTKYDRSLLTHQDLTDNKTWKINWFGRHADYNFIYSLNHLERFKSFVDRRRSGQGYKKGAGENKCPEISRLKYLNADYLSRYSNLKFDISPKRVYFPGKMDVYYGSRLLIKRGISQEGEDQRTITCRYEKRDFCFTSAIHGIKLLNESVDNYLLFLGILLSSFARYYFFNTTSGWGCWHDDIHLDVELLQLPIPNIDSSKKTEKVISIVKELRKSKNIFAYENKKLEEKLDKAVFDLYEFTDLQCNLIIDFCNVTIPFFYDSYNSIGSKKVIVNGNTKWITDYAKCFAEYWQSYLDKDEALKADLCIALSDNIIAIEFFIADIEDNWDLSPKDKLWGSILSQIGENMAIPFGSSKILLEGIVQIITDKSIIIIKRNEKRFWTKSLAYEDAESVMTKRIIGSNTKTRSSK
jgi:type I restriction-modification system DNA methylase subunit